MRQFPLLYGSRQRPTGWPASIPWDRIAPHEAQALKNHCGQSLEGLAERGGLGVDEAVAVMQDRAWRKMEPGEALQTLLYLIEPSQSIIANSAV